MATAIVGAAAAWILEAEARFSFQLADSLRRRLADLEATRSELIDEVHEHRATLDDLVAARRQAEQANQAKSDFIAVVSHELRTPLNGMVGAVQLLDSTVLDSTQRDYHSVLSASAETLSLLIDDLFDLTRIEAGMMRVEQTPCAIMDILNRVEDAYRKHFDQAEIDLVFQCTEAVPRWLLLDPKRVEQVLNNLVGNALKNTQKGRVEVLVDAIDQALLISVIDSGHGLPANPERLFEKFHREQPGDGGLGLGLTICRRLIEQMQGIISAHHHPEGGAEFRLCLPLISAAEPSADLDDAAALTLRPGAQVLLVEDNPINQKVARWNLEQLGCTVTVVRDGASALNQVRDGGIDIIFMDCEMPGMSGFETTRTIRREEEAMNRLPIIALTAHAMSTSRERCLDAGMDDFIAKPFRKNDLRRALHRWIPG
jgi:signal transduction histidine kinase/ActR/RegA family two-component response regulator